jgi:hypothetical protein
VVAGGATGAASEEGGATGAAVVAGVADGAAGYDCAGGGEDAGGAGG